MFHSILRMHFKVFTWLGAKVFNLESTLMSLTPDEPNLKDLESRLSKAKKSFEEKQRPPKAGGGKAISVALQMSIEFVLAIVISSGIGWVIDKWLGSMPWFLIIFFCIGSAAGIKNIFRAAEAMQSSSRARNEESDGPKNP